MKIEFASGKGGTGKTIVSLNLALALSDVQLFDCDVEEPNCNLFLGFELEKVEDVVCSVPVIDPEKCSLCRQCSDFCRYNAMATLPTKVLFFLLSAMAAGAVISSRKSNSRISEGYWDDRKGKRRKFTGILQGAFKHRGNDGIGCYQKTPTAH